MPEKAIVHYIQFPVADHTNTVEVTDEMVAQVYEANKQAYVKPETATNAVPEYKALEEVKGLIVDTVKTELARRAAANAADAIVAQLADEGATFEAVATAAGLEIVTTTPAFTATDRVRGVDPTAPFARATFGLEQDPTHYYSDPVVGRDTVYVIALRKKLPEFLPSFDVVKADVVETAKIAASEKAYVEKAESVHAEVEAALKGGTSFADALAKYNLEPATSAPFNGSAPLEGEFSQDLMGATIRLETGTLADLINTPDEFLIAYVANKEIADETVTLSATRAELTAGIRAEKSAALARAWQESLLDEAGFEDLSASDES